MRDVIKNILEELEEENWNPSWLSKERIEEIVEKIRNNNINVWYYWIQDARAYCELKSSPSEFKYDPSWINNPDEVDFWKKYGKEEYYLLTIEISSYKNFITSWWSVCSSKNTKNRELKKTQCQKVLKNPPNEECKILQEKIIKILEQEGFVYVSLEECYEEFNGKKLYDILFAYI